MTTFEDPQPQSRRAVRESQREGGTFSQGDFTREPPPASQFYSGPGANLAEVAETGSDQDSSAHPLGDRQPTGGGRRAAARRVDDESQGAGPAPASEGTRPAYRVRDFRPDSRRGVGIGPEGVVRPPEPIGNPAAENSAAENFSALTPVVVSSPEISWESATPVPLQSPPLSRRELRQQRTELADSPIADSLAAVPISEIVQLSEIVKPVPAPFIPSPIEIPTANPSITPLGSHISAPFPLLPPSTHAEPPVGSTSESPVEALPASSPWAPPTGHWSTQTGAGDEVDLADSPVNRTVGSGIAATSALVMPASPVGSDIRGPLTGNGEIMLTGSIDLPHALSATGQSDRFDDGSMDALFDLNDAEVVSTDSSPVRAIRAISTHTSGHGVTHTQKPKGTRALTTLLIAASSMAVAVAGLLVAAFAFNVF